MNPADFITRFLFTQHAIRGEIVVLERTMVDVLGQHDYPPFAATLLGEAVVATLLVGAILKTAGSTTLQARSEGPVRLLMTEATHEHAVRGLLQLDPGAAPPRGLPLEGRSATLAITLTPRKGQRYQGIVPLEKPTLAACIEDYFLQSEQLPTRLWIFCHGQRWGGLLLQAMPGPSESLADEVWQHVVTLAHTITAEELLELSPETVLHRLFHEERVSVLGTAPVRFACTCSEERTREAIVALGETEARAILADHGRIETICQFCGHVYRFEPAQIDRLFAPPERH